MCYEWNLLTKPDLENLHPYGCLEYIHSPSIGIESWDLEQNNVFQSGIPVALNVL